MFGLWKKAHAWIETGDYILPMILVSVAHYIGVLAGRDLMPVAAAIGLLVDLGHYRLVKAALKFGAWFWLAALGMTVIAFGYHFAFYSVAGADLLEAALLAVPIPFLIITLAGLSVKERWARKFAESAAQGSQDARKETQSTPQSVFACGLCGAEFPKQQGLAAHIRHAHKAKPVVSAVEVAETLVAAVPTNGHAAGE